MTTEIFRATSRPQVEWAAKPENGVTTTTESIMAFTSSATTAGFITTFVRSQYCFKPHFRTIKVPTNQSGARAEQAHTSNMLEVACDALQQSFNEVMMKLDQIEAKVDLLTDQVKPPTAG